MPSYIFHGATSVAVASRSLVQFEFNKKLCRLPPDLTVAIKRVLLSNSRNRDSPLTVQLTIFHFTGFTSADKVADTVSKMRGTNLHCTIVIPSDRIINLNTQFK